MLHENRRAQVLFRYYLAAMENESWPSSVDDMGIMAVEKCFAKEELNEDLKYIFKRINVCPASIVSYAARMLILKYPG